jgi:hypothetical protein
LNKWDQLTMAGALALTEGRRETIPRAFPRVVHYPSQGNLMPFNTYRPDLMGIAEIDRKGPLVCGSWTSLTLTYTAGHFGIDDLGGIKISTRSASDQTSLQFDDPTAPGYTTITASNGAKLNIGTARTATSALGATRLTSSA